MASFKIFWAITTALQELCYHSPPRIRRLLEVNGRRASGLILDLLVHLCPSHHRGSSATGQCHNPDICRSLGWIVFGLDAWVLAS